MSFLPVCKSDMDDRGWDSLDFLFISGDAYVDHPSFGSAVIPRVLEDKGYKVGIISQPDINDKKSLLSMGVPNLGVLVSSGVIDSMVNNYTASKKPRRTDRYSEDGKAGKRPDRALIKYCNAVREQLGDVPLIIGGVEAGLRRFAHYDYWSGKVRRSILQDSRADILVYGMGEKAIVKIANLLSKGVDVKKINTVKGTSVFIKTSDMPKSVADFAQRYEEYVFSIRRYKRDELVKGVLPRDDKYTMLPSFDEVRENKMAYAASFAAWYNEQCKLNGRSVLQKHSGKYILQNPPQPRMSTGDIDRIHELPYMKDYHPSYKKGVPSVEEVKYGIISHRGCSGGCNFCSVTSHQGKSVTCRSKGSIERETVEITKDSGFKGYIHDVGGPTANLYGMKIKNMKICQSCKKKSCIYPDICYNLDTDHSEYIDLLKRIRSLDKVKKVFIRSGIRHDLVLADDKTNFLREICEHHVSGQLKIAPEHVSENVLDLMGKPDYSVYEEFKNQYNSINNKLGKEQYIVPYLMSGHPGSTLKDAISMALKIKENKIYPEQVQDFYPTPGTVSTTMYHTGIDPLTFERIHVPTPGEKKMQRALLQFADPKNRNTVHKALEKAGRTDLIGYKKGCLIQPKRQRKLKHIKEKGV